MRGGVPEPGAVCVARAEWVHMRAYVWVYMMYPMAPDVCHV